MAKLSNLFINSIFFFNSAGAMPASSCKDLFKSESSQLTFEEMKDFNHDDARFSKLRTVLNLLLAERSRAGIRENWTDAQTNEVQELFPAKIYMSKTNYQIALVQEIEVEAREYIFIINDFLRDKFLVSLTNQEGYGFLGTNRWRDLLQGVLMVMGQLNLSLRQYELLAELYEEAFVKNSNLSGRALASVMMPFLKEAFPNSQIATETGALLMLSSLKHGKECCGHGCGGCQRYLTVQQVFKKMESDLNSSLPLAMILRFRKQQP